MHESQSHAENCFLTLTYDDSHLPGAASDDFRQPGLDPDDLTKFFKRLRKRLNLGPEKLRYFACGEYGERFARPHYHVCLFGFGFYSDRLIFKRGNSGCTIYTSKLLSSIWTDGFASVGELSFESAAYVARYVCKKITGKGAEDHYRKTDLLTGERYFVEPEFARMSLKPGLGATWYAKYASDVFPHDYCVVDGLKVKPPRFYDAKLEVEWPDKFMEVKAERLKRAMACVDDCTPDRLKVREKVFVARNSFKSRSFE